MSEDEMDELRKRRLEQLQSQIIEAQRRAEAQQEYDMQKQQALRTVLTPEARSRLNNIKMVKPNLANQIELQLIQLAQSGRIQTPITDKQVKNLLKQITSRQRDSKVEFR